MRRGSGEGFSYTLPCLLDHRTGPEYHYSPLAPPLLTVPRPAAILNRPAGRENDVRTELLYILLFLSGLFWALLGLAYKVADHHRCRTGSFSRILCASAGACCLLAALADRATPWHDWRLWALGLGAGVLFYLVLLLLMPIYRMGPASVVWIVVNLGILVPIFVSRLLFQEPLYWFLDPLLLALFVLMLLAFQRGMAQASETVPAQAWVFLLALVLLLLSNGLLLTFPKAQSEWFDQQGKFGYLTVFYFSAVLATLLLDLVRRVPLRPTAWEWKAGLLGGLSGGIGMLFFITATALPAAVQYSVNGGVSLLGGVVLTTIFYKERFNAMKVAGLALGTLVLLGVVLRGPLAARLQRLPAVRAVTGQAATDVHMLPSPSQE